MCHADRANAAAPTRPGDPTTADVGGNRRKAPIARLNCYPAYANGPPGRRAGGPFNRITCPNPADPDPADSDPTDSDPADLEVCELLDGQAGLGQQLLHRLLLVLDGR